MYLKVPVRERRANVKIVFDVMSRTTTKYLNIPFLRGTALWDGLPVEIQKEENMCEFKKLLKPLYKQYEDLL